MIESLGGDNLMTDQDLAQLGPAFAAFLRPFRPCFLQDRTARHFDNYCRGLLSDLPRKSVEPIALACGTAVRTLQEFLTTAHWDHEHARDTLQRHVAALLPTLPADPLGTVGVIDETSCFKQGDQTPGVQRQYLGCLGKIDNGIVTVHLGVARGRFQALLDADLYLPWSWDQDRPRCQEAGIPDEVRYQPKWQIALDQLLRLDRNGVRFDWLTFDEGYGSKVPLLTLLSLAGQRFVAEVPVSFAVQVDDGDPSRRADEILTAEQARHGQRFRIHNRTRADQWWRAVRVPVRVAERQYVLVVAFCRATVEHNFRLGKQEAGLMHFEGRQYVGLVRHLILALIVMAFVSIHTERLRGEKPPGDSGASVPGAEPTLRDAVPPSPRHNRGPSGRRGDPLPPAPQRAGDSLPQEKAA